MRCCYKAGVIALKIMSLKACKKMQLQKSFDFDENDHPPVHQPFDVTIWEFVSTHEEFTMLSEAIQKAGLEDVYSGGENDKTVLLLRNEALSAFLADYGYATISDVPVDVLQRLLQYHVITTRFTQIDLPVQEFVTMQTLIDGDDGRINIWKWREYWEIRVNTGGPDQPGTTKAANVYLHNYEFTNGVGHQMKKYVQWIPFE